MFFFLILFYFIFFFSKNLFYKLIYFLIFYLIFILFFLFIKKDIFAFFLILLNASAILIFFTFLIISVNFKTKRVLKKNIIFFILLKIIFLFLNLKQLFFLFVFKYFPLIDLNSNLLFSINDLQKLGFMMYYHYCFWTFLISIFLTFFLIICLNILLKNDK